MSIETIPLFGLGTWRSEPNEVGNAVKEALKIGYNHIDCAHIYQNESEIGEAFKSSFNSGINRNDIWVTSKLWNDSHRPEHVKSALKHTLSNLKLDHLDLYLIHWPIAFKHGITFPSIKDEYELIENIPISETWQALEECVKEGLTRQIGVANFTINKLKPLIKNSEIKPTVNQVELHPYLAQNDLKDFADENGVILTAYSPLGAPHLERNVDMIKIMEDDIVVNIAKEKDLSPAQVLIAWAINRGTSVIPKSSNPGRLKQNLEASYIDLSKTEMEQLNSLDKGLRYIDGTFFTTKSPYTTEYLWG